jgi:hypothetical protein
MAVSLEALAPAALYSQENVSSVFLQSKPQDVVSPEILSKFVEFNHLIGSGTRDFPACSSASATTLPRAPLRNFLQQHA